MFGSRARQSQQHSSKRQQNLLNYYLPLLPYLTFVRSKDVGGGSGGGGEGGNVKFASQPTACNPLPKNFALNSKREKPR